MKQLIFIAGLVFAVGTTAMAAEPAKKEEAKPAAEATDKPKQKHCVTKECKEEAKAKKKAEADAKKKDAKKEPAKK